MRVMLRGVVHSQLLSCSGEVIDGGNLKVCGGKLSSDWLKATEEEVFWSAHFGWEPFQWEMSNLSHSLH